MGHLGIKTGLNNRTITVQVFSQNHGAEQLQPSPRLTIAPLRPHTTCTDHHSAWEKQPTKANHSSLADSVVKFDSFFNFHVACVLGEKLNLLT